jgi:hypothetical protein
MNLSGGERYRCMELFNLFLAAQRRCSETTEIGRTKKAVYSAIVITLGFILGDEGQFEEAIQKWESEIKSFGVITEKEINPNHGE